MIQGNQVRTEQMVDPVAMARRVIRGSLVKMDATVLLFDSCA